jgi:hypothetical protein
MGLVMGFVGLCWGFTPTRKSNLMLTCEGASMLTPKTTVLKTGEPEPKLVGFIGLMVDWFKPTNKSNRSVGL